MNFLHSVLPQFKHLFESFQLIHFNLLWLLGLALLGGTVGGRVFQVIKVPQVVGYILIGIITGLSGFQIINEAMLKTFEPLNLFALGIIGFMIGGELKLDVLKKFGLQFAGILFFEGMTAFAIVTVVVGFVAQFLLGDPSTAWSLALLLGAIASATAPAATTDVLWEYKTKGPLTTMVFGIVAMDDALALFLFAIASAAASSLMSGMNSLNWHEMIVQPLHEICGAISVGIGAGVLMIFLVKKYADRDKILVLSLGSVLLTIGFSLAIEVDMLLAAMTLGMVMANGLPRRSVEVFKTVAGFAPPIYVLFFVLVGAKLNFRFITPMVALFATLYIAGRIGGKWAGAWFGAMITNAPKSVRKYLPYCLLSQAGVAIGLSIVASHAFEGEIGNMIVVVITTTTFVVQLLGPPMTKHAVTKAGEVGLNITEEDLLKQTTVRDLMDKEPPILYPTTPLMVILKAFGEYHYLNYPVVNDDRKVVGIITVDSVRQTFMEAEMSNLFLATDLMEPVKLKVSPDIFAQELKDEYRKKHVDYAVITNDEGQLVGFLEERRMERLLSMKLIEFQQKAVDLNLAA
ncbi:MAG: cation:proton antiporter [Candidatus Omnitrophica bacterium]|nr:cation:proton antiporter [Candidatus Omnitrophota bacterium]